MRRRRRKAKVTWFPNLGSAPVIEGVESFSQLKFQLTLAPQGDPATAVSPITHDAPKEGADIGPTDQLSDVLGNEYLVKRIVGKCFLAAAQPEDDDPAARFPKVVLIACGFFVARANDSNSGGGLSTPIGSASSAELSDNYGVLSLETVREPWMWRRAWILSTGRTIAPPGAQNTPFGVATRPVFGNMVGGAPTTNIDYGSALDGPHFDVKSARRIRQDERLWFAVSARVLDNEFIGAPAPNRTAENMVTGILDYRVLGQLRRAKNSGNF